MLLWPGPSNSRQWWCQVWMERLQLEVLRACCRHVSCRESCRVFSDSQHLSSKCFMFFLRDPCDCDPYKVLLKAPVPWGYIFLGKLDNWGNALFFLRRIQHTYYRYYNYIWLLIFWLGVLYILSKKRAFRLPDKYAWLKQKSRRVFDILNHTFFGCLLVL